MTPRTRHRVIAVTVVAALALAAGTWFVRQRDAGGVTHWHGEPAAELAQGNDLGAAPEFQLVSQTGDRVGLADLRGRWWIADFMFTTCQSSCPVMSKRLADLARAHHDDPDVRIVSFSVDPDNDTPERLAAYAAQYGATPDRWLFLTGDAEVMHALVRDGFHLPVGEATAAEVAAGADPVFHSTRFVLVDPQGRLRGYYDSMDDAAMKQLERDLEALRRTSRHARRARESS